MVIFRDLDVHVTLVEPDSMEPCTYCHYPILSHYSHVEATNFLSLRLLRLLFNLARSFRTRTVNQLLQDILSLAPLSSI